MSKTRQKRLCAENEYIHELNKKSIAKYKTKKKTPKTPVAKVLRVSKKEKEPDVLQEYYNGHVASITISEETRRQIKIHYPQFTDEAIRFFAVLSRCKLCDETGYPRFPQRMLAALEGKHFHTVRVKKYLAAIKNNFLPGLDWKEAEYEEGLCTVIIVDNELKKILTIFAKDNVSKRKMIANFQTANKRMTHALAKEFEITMLERPWRYDDQKLIADTVNTVKFSVFEKAEKNFFAAFRKAEELDEREAERIEHRKEIQASIAAINKTEDIGFVQESARDHHKRMLMNVRDMWKPFYFSSNGKKSWTSRVFGTHLTFLPTELKMILHPDWIDFDLKNCQLAIVAHLFHLPLCLKFLSEGRSIWDHLKEHMDIEDEKWKIAAPFVKDATYSVMFGMEKTKAQDILENELAARGIFWKKRFCKSPLIKEVGMALDSAKTQIEKDGFMFNAYGDKVPLKGSDAGSVFANVAQSYETSIIASCYKLYQKEKETFDNEYDIVFHQHDGFSIILKEHGDLEKITSRFQEVVSQRAFSFNMNMTICHKEESRVI